MQLNDGFKDLEQWKHVEYMVTSLILNSISKEIVEAFLYVSSYAQCGMKLKKDMEKLMDLWFINLKERSVL